MQKIRDILARDLSKPIEEVIKVDQQDEETVYSEIREYVATDRIKKQYAQVLGAIADAPGDPTEGIGVWVSGFFGSGKSSFAKNLGYILANRKLRGENASDLFIHQLEEQSPGDPWVKQIKDRIHYINSRFDAKVLMFDVQVDRAVRRATEPIAEIMYTVLLRELDYAQDYDVAELEIELEGEGLLGAFVQACAQLYNQTTEPVTVPATLGGVSPAAYAIWRHVRKGAQRIQRASAILHQIDPTTYPSADSWAATLQSPSKEADITIRTLVDRTFALTERRRPGHAAVYIIDEVGQYVARSAEKIENLRAVTEHFGQEGKNRVLAGKAVAPVWVIVTSQEKLDEVVAAIDDKRVDLAKLQDRFRTHIDMAPADIREVATRRVLAKKQAAEPHLEALFHQSGAMLKTHTRLERTSRPSEATLDEFVQFYPYLPHYIDISIDIVSGIRLQAGGPRHIGGSNRTIIKQTYEMLVSHRTGLADAPLGTLVSLDRIYELVEGNLPSEKRQDITHIMERWPDNPWPARTAKVITLLEYVRDLPRTETNLAALLYERMGGESPVPHVAQAIQLLEAHQFIHQTEHGWKLLTAQEKSWTAERNAFNPNPRERNDLLEDRLRVIFAAASLTRYRYRQLRNFRIGVTWNRRNITSGEVQVPLQLMIADGVEEFQATGDAARDESRAKSDEIFWVASLTTEVDELVMELFRSRQMVGKYNQLRAQAKITAEESSSLATEKNQVLRYEERLKDRLEATLAQGRGYFRGVAKDGGNLGKQYDEILKGMFDYAVPYLYEKLEMGARPLKGSEAQDILKAANLTGLPKIFYAPPDGLDLVAKEGSKYVINAQAPIVKEVFDYLKREHSYGNKVTGKTLEAYFGGLGYGWEREMVWLVLATLLRGGGLEVTYQGRRYRNHLDPQARIPFSATNAFRAASFAPRQAIDLPTLVTAVKRFEALTGDEVDVEETTIAQAFQTVARQELEQLLPVEARARAHNIPVLETLQEYRTMLDTAINSASDDAVIMLVGEGVSFQELRDKVATIRKATDEKGLARLRRLRTAIQQIWPMIQEEIGAMGGNTSNKYQDRITGMQKAIDDITYHMLRPEVDAALADIEGFYQSLYQKRHRARQQVYQEAIDVLKAQPAWASVPEDMIAPTLRELTDRAEHDLALPDGALVCTHCRATLKELMLDLAAADSVRSQALMRMQELAAPEERIERVRMTDIIGLSPTLSTHEEVDELLEQLGDHLHKLVDAEVKIVLE